MRQLLKKRFGFSLIEVLLYTAIFAISALFLLAILATVTRVQTRQLSSDEVNQQVSFVGGMIRRLVQESSLIDLPLGIPTSTLVLRTSLSTSDPTRIYAEGNILYLNQGLSTSPLTDSNVKVDSFSVTKYENPGGISLVQVDLTLSYNSINPQSQFTKIWKSAISRISAATFDSSLNPNADNNLDLGGLGLEWRDGYFGGNLNISGRVGLGTSPSGLSTMRIKSAGDIGFTNSSYGLVLMAPNGSCYRLTVLNGGGVTTTPASPVTCP